MAKSRADSYDVPGATAVVTAIGRLQQKPFQVKTIQEYAAELRK